MTAYAYELMGIAAGLLLSSQIPYYVPLLSDCQSALASARDAQRPHHKPAGYKKCGIIKAGDAYGEHWDCQTTQVGQGAPGKSDQG